MTIGRIAVVVLAAVLAMGGIGTAFAAIAGDDDDPLRAGAIELRKDDASEEVQGIQDDDPEPEPGDGDRTRGDDGTAGGDNTGDGDATPGTTAAPAATTRTSRPPTTAAAAARTPAAATPEPQYRPVGIPPSGRVP